MMKYTNNLIIYQNIYLLIIWRGYTDLISATAQSYFFICIDGKTFILKSICSKFYDHELLK